MLKSTGSILPKREKINIRKRIEFRGFQSPEEVKGKKIKESPNSYIWLSFFSYIYVDD
jgi:hypothetical protein